MYEAFTRTDRPLRWGLIASLLFHTIWLIAVLLLPAPGRLALPLEESVSVDIVTLPQSDAIAKTPTAEAVAKESVDLTASATSRIGAEQDLDNPATPPTDNVGPSAPRRIKPLAMLSAGILADPRSFEAKKALGTLEPSERIVQLCNIEAMAQIHNWRADFQPDFLVAYAMSDMKLSGLRLDAAGGAFRSRRRWYRIEFGCDVAANLSNVAAFEFLVGDEIPKEQWDSHNLSVDDGTSD